MTDLKRSLADARREISRGIGSISLPGVGGIGGMLGGGVLAGVSLVVKKAIGDYLDLTKSVQQFGVAAQASAAQASTLIGVSRQLGIETSTLDAAFNALKTAATGHPEQFQALGIALKDADGNARPLIDVFEELREKFAGATKDAGTLQVMQELLGTQYRELLPLLGLTSDELANMETRVVELGGVIDEQGIAKAQEFKVQVAELDATWQSFSNTFGQTVVPGLIDGLQGLGQAFDTLGSIANDFWSNIIQGGAHAISGGTLGREFRNPLDVIGESMDAAQRRHDEQVARTRATAAAIVNASSRGGGPSLGYATQRATGGGGRDGVADALRDRIDAIKDAAKAQEQATRDALQAYERERQGVIDATSAEKDARREGHDEQIQQIQDAADAEDQAYRIRDRASGDELDALREEIRGTQELTDLEKQRADIAAAEGDAEAERKVEIFRSAGQSANDYARNVRDQQRRIADADKRVAESKKKLEEDTAKSGVDTRIRAIEAERLADSRLMDDKRAASDVLLKGIHRQSDEEQAAYQARIDGMQAELKAEQQRIGDLIEAESRKTDAVLAELDLQLKEHTRVAAAVGAAWDYATRPRTIVVTATGALDALGVAGGAAVAGSRMGGLREFAAGGAGIITEPTLLVNARTGVPFASVAEHGPEPFAFGGRGGGAPIVIHQNVSGIGVKEAAKLIARENVRELARRAGHGYGRRR